MADDTQPATTHQRTPSQGYGHFSAVLSGEPTEVAPVRRAVADLARASGFSDRATDLALALDELLANASEHGRPPVHVETWYDGRIVLEVSDAGPGFDPRLPTRLPSTGEDGGRGLWIIRQISDHVTISCSSAGTTVRVELSHEPHIGA